MAPPAVAFISNIKLTGELDGFARILHSFSLFLFVLLAYQWRMFNSARFYLSSWAYSFPIAAVAIATMLMAPSSDAPWLFGLAWTLVVLLTAVTVLLVALTIRAAWRREICVEE